MKFKLTTNLRPTGDQPRAIEKLTRGVLADKKHQVLLGVTGSGKTFTMAQVIQNAKRPTLVISHNKTLAAQLYQEFKEFFPENAVHYFVSYYDYYQPEAYIPQTDTYIEKDAKINEEIDRLRHAATQSVLIRNDVIIVASVSCIYGIGDPEEYENIALNLVCGQKIARGELISHLIELQYERSDSLPYPGTFRVRGENIEIYPVTGENIIQIILFGNQISQIATNLPQMPQTAIRDIGGKFVNPVRDYQSKELDQKNLISNGVKISEIKIFPAKHFVTPHEKLELAIENIRAELSQRLNYFKKHKKLIEAQRLETRTNYDLEMLSETGYCAGIENYSRHLSFRKSGEPPYTLLDYFKAGTTSAGGDSSSFDNFLIIIDESHMTIPQLKGMYNGDRARKEILVGYGFRLPSALDNRPLKFNEFEKKIDRAIYVSATPGPYEFKKVKNQTIEQLTRPTGLLDPTIEIHPTKNQIQHLIQKIKERIKRKERVLITVLTKRLAEDLTEYLQNEGIKVQYLHSEIKTLQRPEILRDLRLGEYDVVVGVNLLREGLDLPEVSLVAILDADKEGFLRSETTLIQTMGRAARHINGHVIMYADYITKSMKKAIEETERRHKIQKEYNKKYGIIPKSIKKGIRGPIIPVCEHPKPEWQKDIWRAKDIEFLKKETRKAAQELNFEKAAVFRDRIKQLLSNL